MFFFFFYETMKTHSVQTRTYIIQTSTIFNLLFFIERSFLMRLYPNDNTKLFGKLKTMCILFLKEITVCIAGNLIEFRIVLVPSVSFTIHWQVYHHHHPPPPTHTHTHTHTPYQWERIFRFAQVWAKKQPHRNLPTSSFPKGNPESAPAFKKNGPPWGHP